MSYTKNTWVDQDVERPRTYEVTNNKDGSITLTDSFGLVQELGTPVNAVNMNHIEDGIEDLDLLKANIDLSNLSNAGQGILDNKANISLSNINNSAKVMMSGMAMPSDKYIDLTLGASGTTYTAPANGWINFGAIASQNGAYCDLINNSNGMVTSSNNVQLDASVNANLAVLKNTIVTVVYGYCKTSNLRFIYAEGSK